MTNIWRHGKAKDMFEEERDALLFELDDEEDLAQKLSLVLDDRHLRLRLSRAQERCEREFSAAVLGHKLERVYLDSRHSNAETVHVQCKHPQDSDVELGDRTLLGRTSTSTG